MMTRSTVKRIRTVYGLVLSGLLAVAGICLIAGCVNIYRSGPFSREAVAAAFSPIAAPVYLCLAAIVAGFLLELVLPAEAQTQKAEKNDLLILQRLHKKTDLSLCPEALRLAVAAQQKRRRICRDVTFAVVGICAAVSVLYWANGSNFHPSRINESMIRAMTVLIPCLAIAFAFAAGCYFICRRSIREEISLLRQVKANRTPPAEENH